MAVERAIPPDELTGAKLMASGKEAAGNEEKANEDL
jgi:hypothetical protein